MDIYSIDLGPKMPEFILHPIGSIICFFSLLIYNEIIILNFCGLSKNTKHSGTIRITQPHIDIIIDKY